MDPVLLKAVKLLEALSEECEESTDADHAWRECRRCLASKEVDTASARVLFRAVLAAIQARKP